MSNSPDPEAGVYMLFLNQELVYVGRSKNPAKRIASHRKNGRPFDYSVQFACGEDTGWVERALIEALQPPGNRAGVTVNRPYVPRPPPPRREFVAQVFAPCVDDPADPIAVGAGRDRAAKRRLHREYDEAVRRGDIRSVPKNPERDGPGMPRLVLLGDVDAWIMRKHSERFAGA